MIARGGRGRGRGCGRGAAMGPVFVEQLMGMQMQLMETMMRHIQNQNASAVTAVCPHEGQACRIYEGMSSCVHSCL